MSFFYYIYSALGALPDGVACALPIGAILVLSVLRVFKNKPRPYYALCALVHAAALALLLPRMTVGEALFCVSLNIIVNFPLSLLHKLKRPKRKKPDPLQAIVAECMEDPRPAPKDKPEKIVCFPQEEYRLSERDINLNHVIGLAEKLKRAKLSVGDRLEADNIYRTLLDYRAQNALTAEELSSLNGYLATLLKLAAKYAL